jgi:hypothetical protein
MDKNKELFFVDLDECKTHKMTASDFVSEWAEEMPTPEGVKRKYGAEPDEENDCYFDGGCWWTYEWIAGKKHRRTCTTALEAENWAFEMNFETALERSGWIPAEDEKHAAFLLRQGCE